MKSQKKRNDETISNPTQPSKKATVFRTLDSGVRLCLFCGMANSTAGAGAAADLLGESKVNETQMTAPIDHDVRSLDIAMQKPDCVNEFDGADELA